MRFLRKSLMQVVKTTTCPVLVISVLILLFSNTITAQFTSVNPANFPLQFEDYHVF